MPYQAVFNRLSFQPTRADDPTVPDGPEDVIRRGDLVPDYVPLFQINALVNAGMIVAVADRDETLVPIEEIPEQPRVPEHPAVLPNNPNSLPEVLGGTRGEVLGSPVDKPVDGQEQRGDLPPLPATGDNKATWENFAQQPFIGLTQGEAEAMTKSDLMNEVRSRYAAAE